MISIRKLPTRDIREGLVIVRKRLWEINICSILKVVILKVSKNYKAIFYKHIIGSLSARKSRLCAPEHYLDLPYLGLSVIAWRGIEATKDYKKGDRDKKFYLINNLLTYLYRLNSQNQTTVSENLHSYRYLNLFINKLDNSGKNGVVKRKIKNLINRLSPTVVGSGLEDPVLSNFTIYKYKLCLVDLDNFSETVNFFYEVGFLLADLKIDHQTKEIELKNFWSQYQTENGIILSKYDKIRISLGYISRYAILYLNARKNLNFDYGYNSKVILNYIFRYLNCITY